jgi:diaminohydroxyphosphoribosylaminopyrimidine deaminase/5-amino-6-(5-phosphoribosylamino)uracil reductase
LRWVTISYLGGVTDSVADELMGLALVAGESVRTSTAPNPWVGAALRVADGRTFTGATEPPGGRHAEIVALDAARAAGAETDGSTMAVTLEPCSHHGRTGPCADALVAAGVTTLHAAVLDPDPMVHGAGAQRLRDAGVAVTVGTGAALVAEQLAAYLHHRRTGRPYVVLKLAASLDGRTAAPDGSSRWITGERARADAHRLRAESDAVLVGAATVRADDPELTVRHVEGRDPLRVVLGTAPRGAKVHPAREVHGDLTEIVERLGADGALQVLVEGGATVAGEFHRRGLVDRYVVYLAPVLFGGDDARPMFAGPGVPTIDDVWRGEIVRVEQLGGDLRIDVEPAKG